MNKQEYREYLTTEHWQRERREALGRAEYRCQVCNTDDTPLEVHHRTYARLGSERPSDLFVLCESCHDLFSQNGKLARLDEDEEQDEEWEDDEDTGLLEEEEEMGRLQVAVRSAMNHPRITLGGSSLLLSFAVDIAIRFDPLVVVLGLGAACAIAIKGNDLAEGAQHFLIPGSDQEQTRADADRFAEGMLDGYPVYADQSVGAKIRRLFRLEEGRVVDQGEGTENVRPVRQLPALKRGVKKQDRPAGEGLTYDRIATWLEEGLIDDKQFFELFDRIENPSRTVTRNARNDGAKPAPEGDVSGQNQAVTPVTLPPGWTEEDLLVLPRLYRIESNIDKCLTGIGVSTSQDNRRFAREMLRQLGLLKEK